MKLSKGALLGFLFCTLLISFSGCGQKGPLYLPEDNPEKEPEKRQKRNTPYF